MTGSNGSLRDRILGGYIGSAAGDAMGGPVEGWHAGMIKAVYGRVETFLPYTRRPHRGYALHRDPGSITDDTYICDDFAGFFLAHPDEEDRTRKALVEHLLEHATFAYWWPPAIVPLLKIESGEMTPEETSGLLMGGGAAWWTPIGLVHAGHPDDAYQETMRLSPIWRQPFEQNLISAVQAALAAAVLPHATVHSVAHTLFEYAGPLARKLLARAQQIAEAHEGNLDGFIQAIYDHALVAECTGEVDGSMPPSAEAKNPYRGATGLWAEQIPLAFAALVFGKGEFVDSLVTSVNLGRDTDSIAATTGRLAGALVGLSGMPEAWVETLQRANQRETDLLGRGRQLADLVVA
jgi:ADP-ribosylglycohydrolase